MAKLSKRIKGFLESIDQSKAYNMQEAFKIIKENSKVKFNESVDVSINLGIDAKKSDQNVRGSLVLPNGTGKSVKQQTRTTAKVRCGQDATKRHRTGHAELRTTIIETIIPIPSFFLFLGQCSHFRMERYKMTAKPAGCVCDGNLLRFKSHTTILSVSRSHRG